MKFHWPFIAALALLAGCATPAHAQRDGFVNVSLLAPGVVVDMRYAGSNNFIGRPIRGYEAPVCWLSQAAAEALAQVQRDLEAFGHGLKVYDCYRPQRAVNDFVAWADDPNDRVNAARFYPHVAKSDLIPQGYIASRSGHSRGSTVDLTLVDAEGRELDMGGEFDFFDPRSWPQDASITPEQRANRMLLRLAMQARGFRPYDKEWWHFTLENEPYPDTYFDFRVSAR